MDRPKGMLIAAIVLLAVGMGGLAVGAATTGLGTSGRLDRLARPVTPGTGDDSGGGPSGGELATGRRIFTEGIGHSGVIARTGGFGMMSAAGCSACHGSDGRGRAIGMMQRRVEAPDIRYSTLTSRRQDEAEAEEAWTEADIARAIRTGVEPSRQRLDQTMPRWEMDDTDMADLIAYLKELSR